MAERLQTLAGVPCRNYSRGKYVMLRANVSYVFTYHIPHTERTYINILVHIWTYNI